MAALAEEAVSASGTNIVIPANSSKWVSYGISAYLAKILGNPEVMHDEYTHTGRSSTVRTSAYLGASALCTLMTNGSFHEACIYTVGLLWQTVKMNSVELVRESR